MTKSSWCILCVAELCAAEDLTLAELRDVRYRCKAVGLGAGVLQALDAAIAGAQQSRPSAVEEAEPLKGVAVCGR